MPNVQFVPISVPLIIRIAFLFTLYFFFSEVHKVARKYVRFFLKCFVVLVYGIPHISGNCYISIERKYIAVLTKNSEGIP